MAGTVTALKKVAPALGLIAFIACCCMAFAQSSIDPPLPDLPINPEAETSTVRVAMIDSGVNYQLPLIFNALARTPTGELIGFDFWDMDDRPFDSHPVASGRVQRHGTQTASLLIQEAPFVRLVPYRYPRPDMQRMKQLIEHAVEHDVGIVGMPLGGNRKEEWSAFEKAAAQYSDLLFVASAGNNGRNIDEQAVYPASLDIPNMLVVTSSDDFVRPAQGVNWGRHSVDYLVPAEMQPIVRFDGSRSLASGSSYAVSRIVALAARLQRDDPTLKADGLIREIRSRFANGSAPRDVGQGYVHDPMFDEIQEIAVVRENTWNAPESMTVDGDDSSSGTPSEWLEVPLDVLVLDHRWSQRAVHSTMDDAQSILSQCAVVLSEVTVRTIDAPEYLRDLETGASKTLMDGVRFSGPERRVTVVFARDTRMNLQFDAEAFGRGNTRSRPWLGDSVWLTLALQDRSIGLAHELFHVLANSGQHSDLAGNLMLRRTTGHNRKLSQLQCDDMRANVIASGLGRFASE